MKYVRGLLKATNDKGHLLSTLSHCLAEIREQGLEHVSLSPVHACVPQSSNPRVVDSTEGSAVASP